MDTFLAILGHELRNPLAPITTALSLLRRQNVRSRELDIIERQTRHLSNLVDDLLDVSRITTGKVQLRRSPVELSEVVTLALEMSSDMLDSRRHVLSLNVPRSGLLLEADQGRLAQVFSNILVNAAKYSEPGSRIEVEGLRIGSHVRVTVRDFGAGFSPGLRARIFEMFVQQPQALDRSAGGLGLGLSIARSLVQLHGGTIDAKSKGLGKGSEFVVELPLAKRRAAGPAVDVGRPRFPQTWKPNDGRNRVLVVDDNQDAAELYAAALARSGYEVKTAFDGPSALVAARAFLPHVCILDIGLPLMSGYEVAGCLRDEMGHDVRLVALTGYGQANDKQRAAEAGFEMHLTKPVETDELIAAVGERPLPNLAEEDRHRRAAHNRHLAASAAIGEYGTAAPKGPQVR